MPNKSDYYHYHDPVTLRPRLHNPWRNPMKTGIVSPVFAADTFTYKYGCEMFGDFAPSALTWAVMDGGVGNNNGAQMIALQPWKVTAGVKTITVVKFFRGVHDANMVTACAFEVWRKDAAAFTRIATADAAGFIAAAGVTTWQYSEITLATPLIVTLEAGKEYFLGVRTTRTSANATYPQFGTTHTDSQFVDASYGIAVTAAYWTAHVGALPVETSGNDVTVTSQNLMFLMDVTYTSDNYIEMSLTTPTIGRYMIPRATTPYIVKLEGVVVEDSEALVAGWRSYNNVATEYTLGYPTELDCGDTSAGTNTITHANAAPIELVDISETGQEGKLFDLVIAYRPNANLALSDGDLHWSCRTLEAASHCFGSAVAGTRGTLPGMRPAPIVVLSGTATIAKLIVGCKPVVLVGDSNMVGYLGTFPATLTKPRPWIWHCLGGSSWTTLLNAFKNATVGAGDGWDLIGMGCLWLCASGTNDINGTGVTTDAGAGANASNVVKAAITILADLFVAGEQVVLLGVPPYSPNTDVNQYDAKGIRWLNRGLLGLALMNHCPYYNPWLDCVVTSTIDDATPQFSPTYSDDEVHYNAVGGALVVGKAVHNFEHGLIDLRDAWS
jgi:hypothetical protein